MKYFAQILAATLAFATLAACTQAPPPPPPDTRAADAQALRDAEAKAASLMAEKNKDFDQMARWTVDATQDLGQAYCVGQHCGGCRDQAA